MKKVLSVGFVASIIVLAGAGPSLAVLTYMPASITVEKHTTVPTSTLFDFFGDLGNFSLGSGQEITFDEVTPGLYTIGEFVPSGWQLYQIVPPAPPILVNPDISSFTFALLEGQNARIGFVNRPVVPVPSAALLGGIGAALVSWFRNRRVL